MKIPLDVHEAGVEKLRLRSADGEPSKDAVLDRLSAAMLAARTSAEQLAAADEALSADQSIHPSIRGLRLRELAMKLGERTAAKLDQARVTAQQELSRLEAAMLPPAPANASEAALQGEVRAALARMDHKARGEAIAGAIKRGDKSVTGAVFAAGAPAFLSGLTETELAARRGAWRLAAFPEQSNRMSRLQKAAAALERGGTSFMRLIEGAANSPEAIAAEAATQHSAAATAITEH